MAVLFTSTWVRSSEAGVERVSFSSDCLATLRLSSGAFFIKTHYRARAAPSNKLRRLWCSDAALDSDPSLELQRLQW